MEADFRALLAATISSLVGARIYPSTYPQNATSPAVRFAKITGAPGLHMQGSDGLNFDLVQVDVRVLVVSGEDTATSARDIADAIISGLDAYSGTQGSTQFQLIHLRDDRGVKFESTDAQQFYTISLDLDVIWRAA